MSASRSIGCTSTHGKPNSLADAPSLSSAGAYADDATVATTVLLLAQRPTCDHAVAGIPIRLNEGGAHRAQCYGVRMC
jgi:hypothetical protein